MITAIVTAMTDPERAFIGETLEAIYADGLVTQIIVAVETSNDWLAEGRYMILRLPMMKIGAVRNHAVRLASNDWVAFCDGDDVWLPEKSRTQLRAAGKASVVGSCHYLTDVEGVIRACKVAKRQPTPSTWLVKREVLTWIPFNEDLRTRSDTDWWNRTKFLHKARVPLPLAKQRIRDDSLSSGSKMKETKAQLVRLGSLPVVGKLVYFASWTYMLALSMKRSY